MVLLMIWTEDERRKTKSSLGVRDSEISKHPRVGVRGRAQPAPVPPPWGGVEGPKAPPHLPRDDLDFPDPLELFVFSWFSFWSVFDGIFAKPCLVRSNGLP